MQRMLARVLHGNLSAPINQRIDAPTLRQFADALASYLPEAQSNAMVHRLGEVRASATTPGAELQALTAIVRDGMQQLSSQSNLNMADVQSMQSLVNTLLAGRLPPEKVSALIMTELVVPSQLPPSPALPASSQVLPAQWVNGYHTVVANALAQNLTSSGPNRLTAENVRSFGDAIASVLPYDQRTNFQDQLNAAMTSFAGNPANQLTAVTRITRQILHQIEMHPSPTWHPSFGGNLSVNYITGQLQDAASLHLRPAIANSEALGMSVAQAIATPTSQLPAIPPMPAGFVPPAVSISPMGRTGDSAALEIAITALTPPQPPTNSWNRNSNILGSTVGTQGPDGVTTIRYFIAPGTSASTIAFARQSFHEIEQACNVRFVEVAANEQGIASGEFNIGIREGDTNDSIGGFAQMRGIARWATIIQPSHRVVLHEILHTMGLQHPGGLTMEGGYDENYNRQNTVMSYNFPQVGPRNDNGLGPYDIATLQRRYGAPPLVDPMRVFSAADLPSTSTISAPRVAILDFRDTAFVGGTVTVDMSTTVFSEQMFGVLQPASGRELEFSSSIMPGTHIQMSVDGEHTPIQFFLTGAAGSHLQGGARNDTLVAHGGNNVLTGGRGADVFVFDAASGSNNRITDFNAAEGDRILIRPGFSRIIMQLTTTGGPDGDQTGTIMRMMNGDTESAVVFVQNARPEDIRPAMTLMAGTQPPPEIVMPERSYSLPGVFIVNLPGGGQRIVETVPPPPQIRLTGNGVDTVLPGNPEYDWTPVEQSQEGSIYHALLPTGSTIMPPGLAQHYNSEVVRLLGHIPRHVTVPQPPQPGMTVSQGGPDAEATLGNLPAPTFQAALPVASRTASLA